MVKSSRHGSTGGASSTRRRSILALAVAGLLLVIGSALLLGHDRGLPAAFGQIPGESTPNSRTGSLPSATRWPG